MTVRSRRAVLSAVAAAGLAACSSLPDRAARPAARPARSSGPPERTTAQARRDGSGGGLAKVVMSGPVSRPLVALTFHGSGDPLVVGRLLDLLGRARAPITVFAVGRWLARNPELGRRMIADGHELANHTYTHPALGRLGAAAVAQEIRACRSVLARLTGSGGRWFRPSAMDTPTRLVRAQAGAAGYPVVVGFDVDPHDYADPGAGVVAARVAAGLHPGAIVSLHTGHPGTVEALDPILAAVHGRGLEPVTVGRLLAGLPGIPG